MKPKFKKGDRVLYVSGKDIIGIVKEIELVDEDADRSECAYEYRIRWEDGMIGWYGYFGLVSYQEHTYYQDFMEKVRDRCEKRNIT